MKERHWTLSDSMMMEFVELESTDRGKCCKNVRSRTGIGICHHAAIGKSTAIDSVKVNLIFIINSLYKSLEKFSILVLFSRSIPTRNISPKYREELIDTLRINHNASFRVSYRSPKWAPVCVMASCSMKADHKWGILTDFVRNV